MEIFSLRLKNFLLQGQESGYPVCRNHSLEPADFIPLQLKNFSNID